MLSAGSDEDATIYYEAVSRKRFDKLSTKCAELHSALSRQRAATARRFLQQKLGGDTKGSLIGPGCKRFFF
ncbi:unnamed protein product [Trichobilharzia regenti]|nr:unnamed protein product [Trichobilharzia regenti]